MSATIQDTSALYHADAVVWSLVSLVVFVIAFMFIIVIVPGCWESILIPTQWSRKQPCQQETYCFDDVSLAIMHFNVSIIFRREYLTHPKTGSRLLPGNPFIR